MRARIAGSILQRLCELRPGGDGQ